MPATLVEIGNLIGAVGGFISFPLLGSAVFVVWVIYKMPLKNPDGYQFTMSAANVRLVASLLALSLVAYAADMADRFGAFGPTRKELAHNLVALALTPKADPVIQRVYVPTPDPGQAETILELRNKLAADEVLLVAKDHPVPALPSLAPSVGSVTGNGNVVAPGMKGGKINVRNEAPPPTFTVIKGPESTTNSDGSYTWRVTFKVNASSPPNNIGVSATGSGVSDLQVRGMDTSGQLNAKSGNNGSGVYYYIFSQPTGRYVAEITTQQNEGPHIGIGFNVPSP